ncbi:MAG: hypothetical protein M3N19_12400 [Candidatus Eremiobacteraeota bacterium]|nr:hypothetical protein [Candidatus Eremiobacteraeota bacterium]
MKPDSAPPLLYNKWGLAVRALLAAGLAAFLLLNVLHRPTVLGYLLVGFLIVLAGTLSWFFFKRVRLGQR